MYKSFLIPLIPRPIAVETDFIKGTLFIEGNLEHNYIRFRFCFSEPQETAPLTLMVMAEGKRHVYTCLRCNYSKNEVETPVFHPEFSIFGQFFITNVEPLVKSGEFLTV